VTRRHDVRRVKRHLCYSASEIADLLAVRVATVRGWIREGLEPIAPQKPYLFSGPILAQFLAARNKPRQRLAPGEIYCVACKRPMVPVGGEAVLELRSDTTGDLIGPCPDCGHRGFRRVRLAELHDKAGSLRVRHEDGSVPVSGDNEPLYTDSCAEVMS
jgi:hypothetical protein